MADPLADGAGGVPVEGERRRWISKSSRHRRRKRLSGIELLQDRRRRKGLVVALWIAPLVVLGLLLVLFLPA
jgi:hypothetical protein